MFNAAVLGPSYWVRLGVGCAFILFVIVPFIIYVDRTRDKPNGPFTLPCVKWGREFMRKQAEPPARLNEVNERVEEMHRMRLELAGNHGPSHHPPPSTHAFFHSMEQPLPFSGYQPLYPQQLPATHGYGFFVQPGRMGPAGMC